MKTAEQLQFHVVDELVYDPNVDSSLIAVTASDSGLVTLRGVVPTQRDVQSAGRAARRVRGVRAVANELEVAPIPASAPASGDAALAEAVLCILGSSSVPADAVRVTASHGWLTLEGNVDWADQRRSAEEAVQAIRGVRGVTNLIAVPPRATAAELEERIQGALRRNAMPEARQLVVHGDGGRVTLFGTVAAESGRHVCEQAAYASPGILWVDNRIEVRPLPRA